ncbi:hypothetical protein HanRHA438_Chr01g0004091 [Helianthus annuus]|nr:hypothetical protein HanRHA438_Chr01g0004091 [Helianthus annuus]
MNRFLTLTILTCKAKGCGDHDWDMICHLGTYKNGRLYHPPLLDLPWFAWIKPWQPWSSFLFFNKSFPFSLDKDKLK